MCSVIDENQRKSGSVWRSSNSGALILILRSAPALTSPRTAGDCAFKNSFKCGEIVI